MDYFRRRERRRLLEDLIELQREEDIQRQCESVIYNFKEFERSRDDDEYRNYQHRRKEYCLVKLTYQNPNNRQGRNIDEIMIIQHNRIVFKGCLQDGDQFTFKSKRYRNELKLKFYINELLEDEMTACCEHGLMNRNRHKHLFQIENIVGTKPCYDCELDDKTSRTSSPVSHSNSKQTSSTKVKQISPSISRSSEDQSDEQKPKIQTDKKKVSSEGFSANVIELSDNHTELRNRDNNQHQSDEDSTDVLPSIQQSPSKRTYGPPQLSTMISITESLDAPSPTVREPTSGILFNPSSNTEQRAAYHSNSNVSYNRSNSNLSTERLSRQSSNIETNQSEQEPPMSLNSSNNIAIANDATQLLLTQLGIIRQEQVERPEAAYVIPPREKGNVEYFILIYLHDSNPDESIIKHFRSLVNFFKIFNDIDDCIAFINSISNEKIILILSNSFHNSILPRIEELQQIFTIYILSENDNQVDRFSSKQSKVQGFYSNINDIYEQISNKINKITRDLVVYLNTQSNAISIEPVIVYFVLLSEIILDKNETKDDMKELINFSRQEYQGNDEELKIIDEFENTYKKNQAIYWFSRQCFISKMLNKALRIPEADILYRLRLFIQDLSQQIINESTSDSITVYLGQTIKRDDLDDLQKTISNNDIMIFPQFLFGSTDQERTIRIAKEIPPLNDDYIPLIIRVDISEDMKCANLNSRRYSVDEDNNVLLNMGIMGRLINVEKDNINENQIATIHMRLIKSETERNIQQILEITRTAVKSFTPFVTMIKLMVQTNQQAPAEQMVQAMIDDKTLEADANVQGSIAASCLALAQSRRNQDDYQRALDLYLLSVNTFHRYVSPNAIELSSLYSNIGSMYFRLQNYEKSYEYYHKALDSQLHSNTPDLFSVSTFTNSLGIIYCRQEKYSEAIKSFERTVKVLQQCSEPHDTELASTYNDLGDVYLLLTKYDEGLINYKKAVEIQERIVPRSPQNLAATCHTIGNICLKIGQSKDALVYFKRALEYEQEFLPLTDSSFALLHNNIGLMYYREEQYSDALMSYSKALEIAAISLPENHSLVGITLFNTALVYSGQGKLDEAIETIEKSTEQFLKTLPPDHRDVLENKRYIELIRQKKVLQDIFEENTTSF